MNSAAAAFGQLLPEFVRNLQQLNGDFMIIAMILALIGLIIRVTPLRSLESLGMTLVRLAIIAGVIGSMQLIAGIITDMSFGIAKGFGQTFNNNIFGEYQQALLTKFNIQTQHGSTNPLQFLTDSLAAPGVAFFGSMVYCLSWVASAIMLFASGIQMIVILIEQSISPIFIAAFMIPALVGMATRFCTLFVAVACWPIGFRIADIITKALLDLAVNSSNNQAVAAANVIGGSMILWIAVAVWIIVAYPMAAFFLTKIIVTEGHSGVRALAPAVSSFFLGAAASSVSAGSNVTGMAASATYVPYKNHTTRPGITGPPTHP
jgi:hypothetical protein